MMAEKTNPTSSQKSERAPKGHPGRVMLLLVICIFLIDYLGGAKYTGFQFVWGSDNYFNLITNIISSAVFATIATIYIATKIARQSSSVGSEDIFFIIFSIVLTFFLLNFFWLSNYKAIAHFIFILIFGLVYIKNMDGLGSAFLWTSALLVFDFFGYFLISKFIIFQYIPILTFFAIIYIYAKEQDSFALATFLVLIIVIFVLMWNDPNIRDIRARAEYYVKPEESRISILDLWANLRQGARNYAANIKGTYEQQLDFATGGYYHGTIEETKKGEKRGLEIANFGTFSDKYTVGERVVVWWDLTANPLDEPIKVVHRCEADKRDVVEIGPKYLLESTPAHFECAFEPGTLSKGKHNIKIMAEYGFETMSELPVYFMDMQTLRKKNKEKKDVFAENKIKNTNPQSEATSGPINLVIGAMSDMPIGIGRINILDENIDYLNTKIGVRIENDLAGKGKVSGLKSLRIILPGAMGLEQSGENYCNGLFGAGGSDELHNFYDLTEYGKKKFEVPIGDFKAITCTIIVAEEDVRDLLYAPADKISVHYYSAKAEYTYLIEESLSINIEEEKDEGATA